jgi:molybdate transport system substrate-binding protein
MPSERPLACQGVVVAAAMLVVLCLGCRPAASSRPQPLLVYCGAGIRPPVAEAAKAFGQKYGVTVECDFAGSETLLSRVKLSGRGDVYMPGDLQYVDQARQEGLVGQSRTVCYLIPVILVRKGNPNEIHSVADLVRPGMKIALGDAKACAIGVTAAAIFEKDGISQQDLDPHVVFRSLTVNELGTEVKMGMVDATIVWDAVAAYFTDDADVVPIGRDQNVISTVAVAVLTASRQPGLAGRFVDFITSDAGAAIFRKHHYVTELPK